MEMNKITQLLCLATIALTSSISYADTYCSAVSGQVANAFTDLSNELSSDSKVQLELLGRCSSTNNVCVAVKAPAPSWFSIVEANSFAEIQGKKLDDRDAISSLISTRMKNGSGRCILTRFSGGTALVWVIDGWEVTDKKVRTLNTDNVQLHGETKSPSEITRESEQVGRKLR
jgi:hypothetical protein